MATKRISDEPAYVLHRYDWSESSLILEVFTRHHGRIALVAKGAKRPSSSFRPVLLPLQPLHVGFGGDAEVRTLKSAEWQGGHVMPTGDALLSGYYLNELLMRLLARDDPHEALFDTYAPWCNWWLLGTARCCRRRCAPLSCCCCAKSACCPRWTRRPPRLAPLGDATRYTLVPEGGLREAAPDERAMRCRACSGWRCSARSKTVPP